MSTRRCTFLTTLSLAVAFAAAAPAQKVALGGAHDGQIVQLLDCSRLGEGVSLEGLARIVQALAERSLPAANVRALGSQHIAVLGTPQQCAGAERVFAAAIEQHDLQVLVDCKTVQVDAQSFAKSVQPLLEKAGPDVGVAAAAAPQQVVLTERAVTDLILQLKGATDCHIVQAPKLVVPLLHGASLRVGRERGYTADQEFRATGGADGRWSIQPIERQVFEGSQTLIVATRRGDRESLVQLRAAHTALPPKLPKAEVQLANGVRASIEVPHGATASIDVCAAVPDGEVLLATAPLRDGTFVCWLLQVHAIRGR